MDCKARLQRMDNSWLTFTISAVIVETKKCPLLTKLSCSLATLITVTAAAESRETKKCSRHSSYQSVNLDFCSLSRVFCFPWWCTAFTIFAFAVTDCM